MDKNLATESATATSNGDQENKPSCDYSSLTDEEFKIFFDANYSRMAMHQQQCKGCNLRVNLILSYI